MTFIEVLVLHKNELVRYSISETPDLIQEKEKNEFFVQTFQPHFHISLDQYYTKTVIHLVFQSSYSNCNELDVDIVFHLDTIALTEGHTDGTKQV